MSKQREKTVVLTSSPYKKTLMDSKEKKVPPKRKVAEKEKDTKPQTNKRTQNVDIAKNRILLVMKVGLHAANATDGRTNPMLG